MKKILILLFLLINILYSKEIIINSDLDDNDIKKMLPNARLQNEISSTSKKGWYGGLGIGLSDIKPKDSYSELGITVSLEFGYGINEDFLIHYYSEVAQGRTNEFSDKISETLGGIGISYYINDNHYIKTTVGISLMTTRDDKALVAKSELTGSAFHFGYGYSLSKKQSLEITYASLSYDKIILLGKAYNFHDSSEIITFMYKYRWF